MCLHVLAYNFKRLIELIGMARTMKTVRLADAKKRTLQHRGRRLSALIALAPGCQHSLPRH